MLMSNDYQRIELITGTARRGRWTTERKLRIIEACTAPGQSVSTVAEGVGMRVSQSRSEKFGFMTSGLRQAA